MFGALVLSGCFHQASPTNAVAAPVGAEATVKAEENKAVPSPVAESEPDTPRKTEREAKSTVDHCQLEFTHNKYKQFNAPDAEKGEKVERRTTCLDEKSDADILKIINDAKEQTCKTPFCGCWLG